MNAATQIAKHLKIDAKQITRCEEWKNVYFVVIAGKGARFVSKKAVKVTYHTCARYPGWVFERTIERGYEFWFGTKTGIGYAVHGQMMKSGWVSGELFTRQKCSATGGISWNPIVETRNPFTGTMADCIAEAERRAAYWEGQGEKDVYGEWLKLRIPA